MTRTLLVAAGIHTVDPDAPAGARCLVVDGDRIAWVGADPAEAPPHDASVDLAGAWVTPAFVDAHVHATATGLAQTGVELAGAASAAEVLDRLRRSAGEAGDVLLGQGWDDFGWPEGGPPTAAEISDAAPRRTVLLTRVDGHSCLVDAHLLERLPLERLDGVDRDARGQATGWLREQASHAAMAAVRSLLTPADLAAARAAACDAAARAGIGSFHEMGLPGMYGLDDALAWAGGDWPVDVHTWWGELDVEAATRHGLHPGGDLFLDGSIGSCTAATSQPYGPAGECGELFHADDAVADWFSQCTAAGIGGGVHAIGDRAIAQAVTALEAAADAHGVEAVRACRHRIEHIELPEPDHVRRMARLGVVASVQPAFDAVWGGDDQLYAQRFGVDAALVSNPFAWFAEAGMTMAFGSDSTVTPLDPVGGVRAATGHRGGLSVSAAAALQAHTVGGHHVAGRDDAGRVRTGFTADLAVWSRDPLDMSDAADVRCLSTCVRGVSTWGEVLAAR